MNWFLIALIGFAIGGVAGLICGLLVADDWWRKKSHYFDRLYSNSSKAPYEIEKREDKQV